jgi:chromosome segregation protein
MRLSKIKLSGFKSFVDATTISFPSNLTGIVGPNGCGKSNIIDAIRWVLGESSAKTLRGESMADVIFNGSSTRKPVGQASIELTFDNSDGTITGAYAGYAEIGVRRVVSRDGTSDYFLNNSRCRRKDITHIMLGTGVGSHGYSIIEQGMISRLVEAKPEELRAFLEEAAGISKYKERRRETEHRIRHTRDNLERLKDIRDELEKQLAHLKRQASAAERYKVLKVEERRANAELLLLRVGELRGAQDREEQISRDKQLLLEAAITAEQEVDSSIDKLRVGLSDRHDAFNAVQGVYYKVGAEIARLEQTIQHRRGTIARQEADFSEAVDQIAEISAHMDSDRVELEQLDLVLGRLNPELDQATTALRQAERDLADVEALVASHQQRSEDLARSIATAERMAHVDASKIEQFDERLVRTTRDRAEQIAIRDAIRIDEFELKVDELIRGEEIQRAKVSEATRALETLYTESRGLRLAQSEASDQLDELRETLQQRRGRLSSLDALQEAALNKLSDEADAWVRAQDMADARRLAERLEVEAGWERAVETVLSGYLHAIDIRSLDSVAFGLESLSGSGLALLESAAVPSPGPSSNRLSPLANKLTSPDSARSLLDGCFAADSLDHALANRTSLLPGQVAVTQSGVVVTRHSVRTTPKDDPQLGVIARGEEIEKLRHDLADNAKLCETAAKHLSDIRQRLEHVEAVGTEQQSDLAVLQSAYTEAKTELEGTRARMGESRQRLREIDQAVVGFDDELSEIAILMMQGRTAVGVAVSRREDLNAEVTEHDAEGARLRQRYSEIRSQTEREREHVKEIAILVEARRSTKESAAAALLRIQAQLAHLDQRRQQLKAQIDEVRAPLAGEDQALTELLDKRLSAETELREARAAVEQCELEVREAESQRSARQQKVNESRDEAEAARLAAREIQVRAETISEQLAATGFDLEALGEELPEGASIESWLEKIESLGRRMNRLGSINLAAIDEFGEQSERKEYLDKQFNDLSDALETLEGAIRKIDRETKERFRDTFDKANQGLGRLFPRLFGGGQAYLELDSDDLLNAGVTVMARPPGKRISTIHLMSGGEKALTAVALVFSIFELNPAPFCLLDEVDAPLDDANVTRFSELVREMSQQIQLVLITHNKTTMETMNQLAGVTMHEPGVSRLVTVDIDEAVKLAAM